MSGSLVSTTNSKVSPAVVLNVPSGTAAPGRRPEVAWPIAKGLGSKAVPLTGTTLFETSPSPGALGAQGKRLRAARSAKAQPGQKTSFSSKSGGPAAEGAPIAIGAA